MTQPADRSISQVKRATVMGLGRHGGGVAAANYLIERGVHVTVTDLADEAALANSLSELHSGGVQRITLGRHVEEDFSSADMLVVNPAVRPDSRWVQLARSAGTQITSEIELFLRAVPTPVIGVTGSNGKSTTACMIAACLERLGRPVFLGGNIERSLLPVVDSICPEDFVVLELSSFQLAWLSKKCPRPAVGAITNFSANHLDWHGTIDAYRRAKEKIASEVSTKGLYIGDVDSSWHVWARTQASAALKVDPDSVPALRLPGQHNRWNAALAVAVAEAAGCDRTTAELAVAQFAGLPHRLELFGECQGRQFVNDSQATTPESTIAALRSVERPLRLLIGGADKGADWRLLAQEIVFRAASVACYGQTAAGLVAAIRRESANFAVGQFETLAEAAAQQWELSQTGDAVLLSPACSSLDQFADYAQRAVAFREFFLAVKGQSSRCPPV